MSTVLDLFIVEDRPMQRRLIAAKCAGMRCFKLKEFTDIDSCLVELAVSNRPTVVVTNFNKNHRNGVEFLKTLALYQQTVKAVIVISALTAELMHSIKLYGQRLGLQCIDCIAKRDGLGQLLSSLSQVSQKVLADDSAPMPQNAKLSDVELIAALYSDAYEPYFQPQVDMRFTQLRRVEVLGRLRWKQRFWTPNFFIQRLTDLGRINDYTLQIIKKAIVQLQAHQMGNIGLSVNIAYQTLAQEHFARDLLVLLSGLNFPSQQLTLEVTETCSDLSAKVMANLIELRIHHVSLSIDDFGTEQAGFTQLFTLPFTELKIDRKQVMEIETNQKAAAIIKTMVQLSHELSLGCVAEGIETLEQYKMLSKLGVVQMQGYYFAKPMPIANLVNYSRRESCGSDDSQRA